MRALTEAASEAEQRLSDLAADLAAATERGDALAADKTRLEAALEEQQMAAEALGMRIDLAMSERDAVRVYCHLTHAASCLLQF